MSLVHIDKYNNSFPIIIPLPIHFLADSIAIIEISTSGWGCEEKARGVGETEGRPQGHEGESSLTSWDLI